jgi:tRNA 2-thiouridine synthesizing protein A
MTTATETLDTKGMNCPMPILQAKKSIKKLNSGDTLEVYSTDPGSVRDFASFCKATGNDLLESGEEEGVYRYLIRKN